MTEPTTDFRALCARMADELDHYRQLLMDDRRATHALATEARAALEAQPEPQGPSRPAIEPVLVSERLPGPTDCDAEGQCWWWDEDDDMWRLSEHRPWLLCWTHWLPRWALPVPAPANTIDQNNY